MPISVNGSEERVDLWLVPEAQVVGPELLAAYDRLLSDEERDREQRFHFETDRRRFRVTRALVRTTLSLYVSVDPRAWCFVPGEFGKPAISNPEAIAQQLAFNVSHTAGLIALVVARGHHVGVDVESMSRPALLEEAVQFFAAAEIRDLEALTPAGRERRFFELWTLKESYIKASGRGLSHPLDEFAFRFDDHDRIRLEVEGDELEQRRWCFWQMQIEHEWMAALCVETNDGSMPDLRVRGLVPRVGAVSIAHELSRRTRR